MKKELLNETGPQGDTCGGVERPSGTKDYMCQDDKWVEVDVPGDNDEPGDEPQNP